MSERDPRGSLLTRADAPGAWRRFVALALHAFRRQDAPDLPEPPTTGIGDVLTLTAPRTDDVLAGVTVPVSTGPAPAAGTVSHLEAVQWN